MLFGGFAGKTCLLKEYQRVSAKSMSVRFRFQNAAYKETTSDVVWTNKSVCWCAVKRRAGSKQRISTNTSYQVTSILLEGWLSGFFVFVAPDLGSSRPRRQPGAPLHTEMFSGEKWGHLSDRYRVLEQDHDPQNALKSQTEPDTEAGPYVKKHLLNKEKEPCKDDDARGW